MLGRPTLCARLCICALLTLCLLVTFSQQVIAGPKVTGDRKALLIALQENDTKVRDYFAPLEFPTLDVVKFYQVLKDSKVGRFKHVSVLASRRQLAKLQESARDLLKSGTPDEQQEARAILKSVGDIILDPDTPQMTLVDNTGESQLQLPKAQDVREAIQKFVGQLHEEDEAFIYVSGHGFRARPSRGPIGNAEDVVLVAADTVVDKDSLTRPYTNGFEIGTLLETLGRSPCKRVVVLQATCASKFKTAASRLYEEKEAKSVKKGETVAQPSPEDLERDHDQSSITLIGAAREFAYEARSASEGIRGDLFSYFFRLAMTGQLGEKVSEWRGTNIDADRDTAISVLEAYNAAEVAVRRITAPQRVPKDGSKTGPQGKAGTTVAREADAGLYRQQQPYLLQANGQGEPFIMAGAPDSTRRRSVVFPPWHRRRLSGEALPKKGMEETGFSLWLEGPEGPREVTEPMALEPGKQCLQLREAAPASTVAVEGSATGAEKPADRILERRCVVVGTEDEIRWDIFRDPSWSLETSLGVAEWFGPEAYPGQAVGSGLSMQTLLDIALTQTVYRRADRSGSIEVGGRVLFGIEPQYLGSAPKTADYSIEAGVIARHRRPLYGRWPLDLTVGIQGSLLYLSNYEYRKTMLVPGWGPQVGFQWPIRRHQFLSLNLDVLGLYADLDCNPDIQDWPLNEAWPDETKEGVAELKDLLETRCELDGDRFVSAPGLYVQSSIRLGWAWRF